MQVLEHIRHTVYNVSNALGFIVDFFIYTVIGWVLLISAQLVGASVLCIASIYLRLYSKIHPVFTVVISALTLGLYLVVNSKRMATVFDSYAIRE